MQSIRQIILARLRELKWSRYRLAKEAQVNEDCVNRYLRGDTELRSDALQKILITLNLEIQAV